MGAHSRRRADLIEDLEFLDSACVGAIDAARRSGFPGVLALEKWCERHDLSALYQRMKARDPEGLHYQIKKGVTMETTDTIAALVTKAQACPSKRIQRKADRLSDLIAEVRSDLAAFDAAERDKSAARAEVDRLEKQLAEAKARLRGAPAEPTAIDAKAIRQWARMQGIDVPAAGRVPAKVRAAYEAAS